MGNTACIAPLGSTVQALPRSFSNVRFGATDFQVVSATMPLRLGV